MNTATITTMSQFKGFVKAVLRLLSDDFDPAIMQGWIENQNDLRRVLCEALTSNDKLAVNAYPLSVDYERSVEDGVRAGRYDYLNSNIASKNFSTTRKGTAEIVVKLIHFNRYVSTGEALHGLDRIGFRPADLHELLAFGEKYPKVQRKFPVVALGSVWQYRSDGRCFIPYLFGSGLGRGLELGWIGFPWGKIYRFAAIRK